MVVVAVALGALGASVAGLRWLRVSQREHYLAGSSTRFAIRWWRSTALNALLVVVGLAGALVAIWVPLAACVTAGVVIFGPRGLTVRGRTSTLSWTRRLKTLAAVTGSLSVVVLGTGILLGVGPEVAALVALGIPLLVDAAAALLAPMEARASEKFVSDAKHRLERVRPRVVGITGSYGKTSTKNHLTTLLGTDRAVVPSPRSFNNRAGLARAINENLAEGTDVFIAEMGTYGPGEIAEMVAWCPPQIAVLTAIGPVHLERFGSLDVTLAAKAEITASAEVVVLNADDERLAGLAAEIPSSARVLRTSASHRDADVSVVEHGGTWEISTQGTVQATVPVIQGVQAGNVACALGAAIALGTDPHVAAERVANLVAVENRLTSVKAPSGVTVIDDTFNSNPAGAAAALDLIRRLPVDGRRVVVTPGMIELGECQRAENEAFARSAAEIADVVVIVGRTNAAALEAGARQVPDAEVRRVRTREEAVNWVRASLGLGDAVLYENDLPDHYP